MHLRITKKVSQHVCRRQYQLSVQNIRHPCKNSALVVVLELTITWSTWGQKQIPPSQRCMWLLSHYSSFGTGLLSEPWLAGRLELADQ